MNAADCRAARKARATQEREARDAHYLRAIAHRIDPITWLRDRRYGRNEPLTEWVRDERILLAGDIERQVMQALGELAPLGLGLGSGT